MIDKLRNTLNFGEFECCIKIARVATTGDVVVTKMNVGNVTNRNVALKALSLLDIIESHSCGCNGVKLMVVNKPLVNQLALLTLSGEVNL